VRALGLVLLLGLSCSPTLIGDGPRKAVVRHLVTAVILPTYADFVTKANELAGALDALETAPSDETLAAAQAAWRAARLPWKETEAYVFGPAKDDRLLPDIDQPYSQERIDEQLLGAEELTDERIAAFGANQRGFHGIEYVLFSATALDARRLRYLAGCGRALAADAARLHAAWDPSGGDYATKLIEAGDDGAVHPTIKAVVDDFINEGVALTEKVADRRLGDPMGKSSGGTPRPELAESPLAEASVADMTASLRGIRNIYFGTRDGTPGQGLDTIVAQASPVIAKRFREEILAAVTALETLPPLSQAVVDADPRLETAYLAVKEVRRSFTADVTAALGATLTISDNDGD
jgi:uncharacterized protein